MSTRTDLTGDDSLAVTVSSDWGHFRRIDTTTTKHSYRVIPRTTAIGLLAAVLGRPRDSYYREFDPGDVAIGISVENPIQRMNLARNELSIENGSFDDIGLLNPSTITGERQQRLYEYLKDPAYRLYINAPDQLHDELVDALENGQYHYTPYLGKSECIARLRNFETARLEDGKADSVETIAPVGIVDASDDATTLERTPHHMESSGATRAATGFVTYGFRRDAGRTPVTSDAEVYSFNDDYVTFL